MENEKIVIALTTSNDYAEQCCVVMTSILCNCKKNVLIDFFILTSSLRQENKNIINQLKTEFSNCEIKYITIDESEFSSQLLNSVFN